MCVAGGLFNSQESPSGVGAACSALHRGGRPEKADQRSVSTASWSLIKETQRQLAVRVHKGTGLLTPDVRRIWLSMYAPGTTLVLLQVHIVGAVRPLVFKVPGVTMQRYVGALTMDSHFMELQ